MKKNNILLLLSIITISVLLLIGCGKITAKSDLTETNNNENAIKESKENEPSGQDSHGYENQGDPDDDLEESNEDDSDNEVLPDGWDYYHYDPEDDHNQIHSAQIDDNYLYLEYIVYESWTEGKIHQLKIPISETIEWRFSWFTERSFNNYEAYDSIAVSEIAETFNKVFDEDTTFYYEHLYVPSGCDGWPHYELDFEIKDGKIVVIYLDAEIG